MDAAALEADADAAAAARNYGLARELLLRATTANADRFDLWLKLSAMCRATGDPAAALAATDRALAIQPLDFMALLIRATQLEALANTDRAGQAYGHALEIGRAHV